MPQVQRFTDISINTLPVPEKGIAHYWERPLGVRVTAKGVRAYIVLVRSGERKLIARVGVISLREARVAALRLKADHQPQKYKAPPMGLAEARTAYLSAINVRPSTRRYYVRYLNRLSDMPLESVTPQYLTGVLDQIGIHSRLQCFRVFAAFFNFCVPRYLKYAPTTGLRIQHKQNSRTRVLSNNEIRALWAAADQMDGHFPTLLKLLLITGQRRSEIAALKAEWIAGNSICLPQEVTKNGRLHMFPIGTFALSLLPSSPGRLFPARGSDEPFKGWSKSMIALRTKLGPEFPHFTLHDARRTLCTKWAEDLRIAPHLIERYVNHVSGQVSGVAAIYNRATHLEELRECVDRWEALLQKIIGW
jgi:integrase